jgi:hypothetical protein
LFGLALGFGIAGVVLIDVVGSLAARGNRQRYAAFAPLSYVAWAATGAIAARLQQPDVGLAIARAALASTIVGLFDATAGWWISTRLGATPLATNQTWKLRLTRASTRVAARAALAGVLGGAASAIF